MPEVSVIIPAYNAGATIDAALQSVVAQTFRDFEVVVVDDGSTDDTAARIARWADRVTCIRQDNHGPAHARNQALEACSGRLIAFLDADDVWLPRKLERQVGYFRRFPSTGLLHTATLVSASPVKTMAEIADALPLDATGKPPSMQFGVLFHDTHINTLTVMVPRDVLMNVGLFDERRELHVEDWDLWLRIAARYPIGALPMPLAIRRPGGGMSNALDKTFRGQELVVEKNAPLAELTCERHPGRRRACIESRLHRLHSEEGYMRFWRGDMRGAREAFTRAAGLRRFDVRAWAYAAASWAGTAWGEPVRRIRLARTRSKPGARPSLGGDPRVEPAGLVQDTTYRRARRTLSRAAHTLDDVVSRSGRKRVLFEAASPMSLAVFQPVLDRIEPDARLEFWFTSSDERWTSEAIFGTESRRDRIIRPADARWTKFDAYINTDFWNTTWPRRCTRRIHLFHGVAGKYGLDAPVSLGPVLASFDRLMFPNRDRLRRYAEAGLVDADSPRAALVGYPKVDCLVDGSLDRRTIEGELGLDPSRPTVLYAPTWSAYSSLASMGEEIVDALLTSDVNVVVKLHDRSIDPNRGGAGSIDWRARLRARDRKGRIHIADGPNASPYMFVADAMVTDHSSVGFEYMLLDRPIVVIDCPQLVEHARINRQKVDLLRSAADLATNATELSTALGRALTEPRRHGERRAAIANELFYCAGRATGRAVQCIYESLSLPEPEAQAAARPAEIATRPIPHLARNLT